MSEAANFGMPREISLCVLALVGGGIGALARHCVNEAARTLVRADFPVSTLVVNCLGSLLVGVAAAALGRAETTDPARVFAMTGLLGGFTTFSAFSLETMSLVMRGAYGQAAGYVGASLALSIAAVFAGFALVRAFGATS